jgi:NADH-quinone oxidoreductase subunit L
MARLLFMTFFGEYRGGEHHPHESPWSMLVPLVILAVGSAVGGFVHIPRFVEPVFRLAAREEAHHIWLPWVASLAAVAGIAAAYYLYVMYTEVPDRMAASLGGPYRLLQRKYGFDDLYNWIARRVVVDGSRTVLWRGLDAGVIDAAVNGTGNAFRGLARGARTLQTGLVRGYALVMLGGAVALVTYFLWPR